jgi:formylglycine-generating enzyme required for sulfatase activity
VQQGVCKAAPVYDPCNGVECAGNGACMIAHDNTPTCLCRPGYLSDGAECRQDVAPDSPCKDITCSYNGSCVVTGANQPLCVCDQGYHRVGNNCVATPNPCAVVNCGEHGRCALGANGTICVCDPGYTVQQGVCEVAPVNDPCDGVECAGDGVCMIANDNTAVCLCRPGYHSDGTQCVQDLVPDSPCAGVTCNNRGSCVVTSDNEPLCICDQGNHLSGGTCVSTDNPCTKVYCGNNQLCVVTADQEALCVCEPGYLSNRQFCNPSPCEDALCDGSSPDAGSCIVTDEFDAICVCGHGYRSDDNACVADACSAIDCGNGTCVLAHNNQPVCICDPGYQRVGGTCVADPCSGVTCDDYGSCTLTGDNQPLCVCHPGYQRVDGTCVANPCLGDNCGGNGSCVLTGDNQPLCVCNQGYHRVDNTCVRVEKCSTLSACRNGWCLIPPCTFVMGSPSTEACRDGDEGPAHLVTITRPFIMGQREVTQGDWESVFNNNPSQNQTCGEDCPVDNVSWYDAVAYANTRSTKEGLPLCYITTGCTGTPGNYGYTCTSVIFQGLSCTGYRLPTEAEWEYAARAGTTTAYWIGGNIGYNGAEVCNAGDPSGIGLSEIAWYGYNSGNTTQVSEAKLPNPWGLYDLYGNIGEWVYDWYKLNYYQQCSEGDCTDPVGPPQGTLKNKVKRGGDFSSLAGKVRSASRGSSAPATRSPLNGFRVVRSLP